MVKQAVKNTKNVGIDQAIDEYFKLQKKQAQKIEEKKTDKLKDILRPKWNCKVCTLINMNSLSTFCIACGSPAPKEAYYSPKEKLER